MLWLRIAIVRHEPPRLVSLARAHWTKALPHLCFGQWPDPSIGRLPVEVEDYLESFQCFDIDHSITLRDMSSCHLMDCCSRIFAIVSPSVFEFYSLSKETSLTCYVDGPECQFLTWKKWKKDSLGTTTVHRQWIQFQKTLKCNAISSLSALYPPTAEALL